MDVDRQLELDVLARAARDGRYRDGARRLLDGHRFSDGQLDWLWEVIAQLPTGDRLTAPLLRTVADRTLGDEDERDDHLRLAVRVLRLKPQAAQSSLIELEQWVVKQDLQDGMERAIRHLERGNVQKAREAMQKAARSQSPVAYRQMDFIDSIRDRMAARKHLRDNPDLARTIPTKLGILDKYLDGGIRPSEMGIIVGTTGRGKSAAANHIALTSALAGFTTLLVSTEMSIRDDGGAPLTRLDAAFLRMEATAIRAFDFDEDDLEYIENKIDRSFDRLQQKLKVISIPIMKASTAVIQQALDDMDAEGRPVGLLVVDSLDHIKPEERTSSRRDRETLAYWEGKSLVDERDISMWSTAHAPASVVDKLCNAETVGETYDKSRISDWVFTLNQTKAEKSEGRMRGYLPKGRHGVSNMIVPLQTDLAKMIIEAGKEPDPRDDDDSDE